MTLALFRRRRPAPQGSKRAFAVRGKGNSPTLDCSCGRSFSADTWEEAGIKMDEHLEDHGEEERG